MSTFKRATKEQAKLRMFLAGPSGSGKTWTALSIAAAIGGRVAVIDTEHHSASKYADKFEFDALNLDVPTIPGYEKSIRAAAAEGYDVLVIDSLTHAWMAAQQMLDDTAARMKTPNSYMAWGTVTPLWNGLLRTIITSNLHVIGTSRSKTDYILETDNKGRQVPKKVGMAPVMRDGAEYEFDIAAEIDLEHRLIIGKTRCAELDGQVYTKPTGQEIGDILKRWLNDGTPKPPEQPKPPSGPPMSDEQIEFNAWAKPLVESKSITGDRVRAILGDVRGDYAKAKPLIESELQPAS